MPVRPATLLDEPAIVTICTAAFFDEALFGPVIHPRRNEYPEDVRIFWHEWIRSLWRKPKNLFFVSTTTENDEEIVTGVAVWERQGDDEGALKVEREWVDIGPEAFEPLPTTVNRALDPSKRTVLQDAFSISAHHWNGDRAANWYLSLCGVHPDYHRKGFGRELVQWGLDLAREENVHASVVASDNNDTFYMRCGFDEVVGNCCQGEGNPLLGVPGGNIVFMWPKPAADEANRVARTP